MAGLRSRSASERVKLPQLDPKAPRAQREPPRAGSSPPMTSTKLPSIALAGVAEPRAVGVAARGGYVKKDEQRPVQGAQGAETKGAAVAKARGRRAPVAAGATGAASAAPGQDAGRKPPTGRIAQKSSEVEMKAPEKSNLRDLVSDELRKWLLSWLEGRSSTNFMRLAADAWLREMSTELRLAGPVPDSASTRAMALISGLLTDPSLREISPSLHAEHLESPCLAATCALQELQEAVGENSLEDELLASQVEVALGRLESSGAGDAFLKSAMRREILRCLWCFDSFEQSHSKFTDEWILLQLERSALAAEEEFSEAKKEVLQAENRFMDRYLVQLLKLKRGLASLLDAWEKVDHYQILGVSKSASDKELRNAYRKACLRLHPDKGGDKLQFQQLQDAYAHILEERQKEMKETKETKNTKVCSGLDRLQQLVKDMRSLLSRADEADAKIKHLGPLSQKDSVEMLATAQEAGEALLTLSQEIGEICPSLSEASMEVAESSLSLAAQFASVPCALLLTDVALSCTFEASRLQHTGKALIEVRRDTTSTLHTLQANLNMAKILGTVDAETFKLSVGLVRKATTRIMASIAEVRKATVDAMQRGHHCLLHARAVCRFEAERCEADPELLALEAEEAEGNAPVSPRATGPAASEADAPNAPPEAHRPAMDEQRSRSDDERVELLQRRRNDRLLRQLNGELRELQRRVKGMAKARGGEELPGALSG
eukprot:g12297.t1